MSEQDSGDNPGAVSFLRSRYMFKIGAAVIVVALVLAAIGFFTFTEVQASVESDAKETLIGSSEREAAGIGDFLQERNSDVIRLGSSESGLAEASTDEIREEFADELRRAPSEVEAIHYYDMDNFVIEASTDESRDGQELVQGELPWVIGSGGLDRPSDVRSFEPYDDEGEKRLGFASSISGQESHAVVMTVDLERRSELLSSPIEGGAVNVVSHTTGNVVLAQDLDGILTAHPLIEELPFLNDPVSASRSDQVTADTNLVDDSDLIVATAPIEGKSWSVTMMAPQSTVFSTVDEVTFNLALLIAVALVGLLAVGAVITRDINNSLDEITEYAQEIEDGNLGVEIDSSRSDEFGTVSVLFARIRDSLKTQIEDAESARQEAEVAQNEAEEMATYLQQKSEEYSEVMQQVSAGDLTRRMEKDGKEDSMDRIAEEFNEMTGELEKTTGQLKSYVDEVEESGAEVEQSSRTVREASEQVAHSIQKISDDAYNQKDRLDDVARSIDTLADRIEELAAEHEDVSMADSLQQLRDTSEELDAIADLSQATMAESQEVAGAAEEQAAELNNVSERASDLQRYAEPLRDILERFETEEEHEFVFSVGPTGGAASPSSQADGDDA